MVIASERIRYPDFDTAQFNVAEAVNSGPVRQAGYREFRRLSPFNAPEDVQLEVRQGADALTVIFSYPNDEPGEREERVIDEYFQRRVLLGKHTRKILRLKVGANARELLLSRTEILPRNQANYWLDGLPEIAFFPCIRNCEVASDILSATPQSIRQDIVSIIELGIPNSDSVAVDPSGR